MNYTVLATCLSANSFIDRFSYSVSFLYGCAFRHLYVETCVDNVRPNVPRLPVTDVQNTFH